MDLLLKRESSSFTKVVFPTCRAPYRIKTLPSKKRSSKAENKIRAIIFQATFEGGGMLRLVETDDFQARYPLKLVRIGSQ